MFFVGGFGLWATRCTDLSPVGPGNKVGLGIRLGPGIKAGARESGRALKCNGAACEYIYIWREREREREIAYSLLPITCVRSTVCRYSTSY